MRDTIKIILGIVACVIFSLVWAASGEETVGWLLAVVILFACIGYIAHVNRKYKSD